MAYGDDDDDDPSTNAQDQQTIDQPDAGGSDYQPSSQQPLRMTWSEYQQKYGGPLDERSGDTQAAQPTPRQPFDQRLGLGASASAPIRMTWSEYQQKYGGDAQDQPEAGSQLTEGLRAFAHSVAPTLSGIATGAATGAVLGGGIPGFIGGAIAGGLTSYGVSEAQEAALNAAIPGESQRLAAGQKAYPWTTTLAGAAPAVLGLQPGTAATTLAQRLGTGALTGATDIGMQYATTGEVDPRSALVSAATGFALPGSRPWLESLEQQAGKYAIRPVTQPAPGPHTGPGPPAAGGTAHELPKPPLTPPVDITPSRAGQADDVVPGATAPTEAERPEVTQRTAPPADTVRFYHGGDDPQSGGGRWVSPSLEYASNYRPGQSVHYVDIPQEWLDQQFPDTDLYKGPTAQPYPNFEAPEEFAQQMKPVGDDARINKIVGEALKPASSGVLPAEQKAAIEAKIIPTKLSDEEITARGGIETSPGAAGGAVIDPAKLGNIQGDTIIGATPNMRARLRDGTEMQLNAGADVLFDGQGNLVDPNIITHIKSGSTNGQWVPVKPAQAMPAAQPPGDVTPERLDYKSAGAQRQRPMRSQTEPPYVPEASPGLSLELKYPARTPTGEDYVAINDAAGNEIGHIKVSRQNPKVLGLTNIHSEGGPNSLGMDQVRRVLYPQLRQMYPEAEVIRGGRISGAAPGREAVVPIRRAPDKASQPDYGTRLKTAETDNAAFDQTVAALRADKSITADGMRQIAKDYLGYNLKKSKGRDKALEAIVEKQQVAQRGRARAANIDKDFGVQPTAWTPEMEAQYERYKQGGGAGPNNIWEPLFAQRKRAELGAPNVRPTPTRAERLAIEAARGEAERQALQQPAPKLSTLKRNPETGGWTFQGREEIGEFATKDGALKALNKLQQQQARPQQQKQVQQEARQPIQQQVLQPHPSTIAQGPTPPAGPETESRAFKVASAVDDDLHRLTTVPAADAHDYINRADEAAKLHPEIKGTGGERIYKAIENGTYDQLPENLKAGYEKATSDLMDEAKAIRKELVKRGEIDPSTNARGEPDDPNYVHRILRSTPAEAHAGIDPLNEGRLPGMFDPSSTKELEFRGAQAKDGSRLVISAGNKDKIGILRNGTRESIPNPKGDILRTGDRFTYQGKDYTVDRGITDEIEKHAIHADGSPVRYFKNAFFSAFDYHRQMKAMKAYSDWKRQFISPRSPAAEFMTRDAEKAQKLGYRESGVPDFAGVYMHPDLAQVLHNNYQPGLGGYDRMSLLRAINQFAVRSIFWNPVPHSMNAFMHYLVARGWDWVPGVTTRGYGTWMKSLGEGFKAAYTQDALLQDMNRSGVSLIMSKIDSQNIGKNLGSVLQADLRRDPAKWEQFARQWGLGTGVDAINAIYNGAQRALWTFSDGLMASRIRELEMSGMTREQAIDNARIHIPDYRLPIKFMGSRGMVNIMSDPRVMVFGRYHMGMLNSLGHMANAMSPLGQVSAAERTEALGNVFALGMLGLIVKPLIDKGVQYITGNKDAEMQLRGPLSPLTHTYNWLKGESDISQELSNVFTRSPALQAAWELMLTNRDFTGRNIREPKMPLYQQAGQTAEYAAEHLVSPYATFGPALMPGTAKGSPLHELLSQAFDVKVPTAKQMAGKAYGQKMLSQEAKTRAKKPRGLIEYGVQQLSR